MAKSSLNTNRLSVGKAGLIINYLFCPDYPTLIFTLAFGHHEQISTEQSATCQTADPGVILQKQVYANILKILPQKTESFQIKILIFFIFLLKT